MKKTLIALAAVAATGAAFAQSSVSLSGEFAYGYQSETTGGGATVKGFGMDTSAVTFAVTEDLGGGLKVAGSATLGGIARNGGTAGEDMKLSVSGGFGTLTFAAMEIGSGIRGLAQAGAPVNNMEGEVLAPAANYDYVGYTAPKMGDFTFSASLTENAGAPAIKDGMSAGQSYGLTAGVAYGAGPVAAKIDFTDGKNPAAGKLDSRYRISGSYDLGVAKVGAGYERQKLNGGGTQKYTMFGVNAPIGAFNVGAAWVKSDASATAGSKTGYTIGASYALSKRTMVKANYASWEQSEAAGALNDKKTTILLVHDF